ncbi:hypothetical protein ACHAP5_011935, partial [Fusarium lateritium]
MTDLDIQMAKGNALIAQKITTDLQSGLGVLDFEGNLLEKSFLLRDEILGEVPIQLDKRARSLNGSWTRLVARCRGCAACAMGDWMLALRVGGD